MTETRGQKPVTVRRLASVFSRLLTTDLYAQPLEHINQSSTTSPRLVLCPLASAIWFGGPKWTRTTDLTIISRAL